MLEKEIKILEINVALVCQKLTQMGAIKTFEGDIHDIYYDFPDEENKKHKMHQNKRMFRVRKKGETHLYTIKNKRSDVEQKEDVVAKDEHEMEITDVESFSQVLEKYGMKQVREKKKHRISYALNGAEFDIDTYEGIPSLLEIEEESEKNINIWIEKLELQEYQTLLGGSKKLFKHYGKEYSYL